MRTARPASAPDYLLVAAYFQDGADPERALPSQEEMPVLATAETMPERLSEVAIISEGSGSAMISTKHKCTPAEDGGERWTVLFEPHSATFDRILENGIGSELGIHLVGPDMRDICDIMGSIHSSDIPEGASIRPDKQSVATADGDKLGASVRTAQFPFGDFETPILLDARSSVACIVEGFEPEMNSEDEPTGNTIVRVTTKRTVDGRLARTDHNMQKPSLYYSGKEEGPDGIRMRRYAVVVGNLATRTAVYLLGLLPVSRARLTKTSDHTQASLHHALHAASDTHAPSSEEQAAVPLAGLLS